jgi:fructokinase
MGGVVCLGELLIDFCASEADVGLGGATTFTKAPGGAPANVAVAVGRLGEQASFLGAVGDDPFGAFLTGVLAEAGVDTSPMVHVPDVRTSLAFIAARSDGCKDITFYRNPGADMCLAPEHVSAELLAGADALHFGSISRIDPSPRSATDRARELAGREGKLISYDPNYRASLWPDADAARERIAEGFAGATLTKISDEEWAFVTGSEDFEAGARRLLDGGMQLVVRSEGDQGASFATATCSGHVDGFEVTCVEPTGAGDGQVGCLIVELLAHWRQGRGPGDLDEGELRRIVRRANAVGALACTQVGAIPSLPPADAVDRLVAG